MRPPARPNHQPSFLALSVPVLLAVLALLTAAPVAAADADPRTPSSQSADSGKEPKCVHGCERWGKVCNVDPRGAYKCRRRCEKFGKICE